MFVKVRGWEMGPRLRGDDERFESGRCRAQQRELGLADLALGEAGRDAGGTPPRELKSCVLGVRRLESFITLSVGTS